MSLATAPLVPAADALAALTASDVLRGLFHRLGECFQSFWFLLTHDNTGMTERAVLVPYFLAAWLLAGLLACPLTLLPLRAMGVRAELPRVVAVNFGILLTELVLFGINWGVIGWGDRHVDQAVFAATLVPGTVIALWGLDLTLPKAVVHAIFFALLSLGVLFLGVFVATELGLLKL